MKVTDEQIKILRRAIQQEIEVASIDGMEHGAWGFAEKQANEMWKEFQESFNPVEINGIKNENAEVGFEEWFTGNYGKFSCRSEWFYGDCEVKDEKIRKDLVYNWVRSAYVSGYEHGGTEDD
jgi:hypothetical protein